MELGRTSRTLTVDASTTGGAEPRSGKMIFTGPELAYQLHTAHATELHDLVGRHALARQIMSQSPPTQRSPRSWLVRLTSAARRKRPAVS
jgi:hypothetical protein